MSLLSKPDFPFNSTSVTLGVVLGSDEDPDNWYEYYPDFDFSRLDDIEAELDAYEAAQLENSDKILSLIDNL